MKGKVFWGAILLLLININQLFAQGCTPGDPDFNPDDCPLDTWVLILVAIALVFVTVQLYNRKRLEKMVA